MKFCATIIENCKNIEYSDLCRGCENCFGCVGLKNAKYRILNKQYTPDDYFRLVDEIKDAMKKDGSYGEFFPLAYSPHPFNHSTAFDFHDLTKEQAEAFGMRWEEVERLKGVSSYVIPDTIGEIPVTITNELLSCETCQKKYRVTGPETSLYLKQSIPLPRKCFDCRHMTRVRSRNPRKFWERSCMNNCGRTFQTTFSPERPDKVFCETCFHQAIN